MTEARDIEEIVAEWDLWLKSMEFCFVGAFYDELRSLIADWRAKKEEIGRIRTSRDLCEKELDVLSSSHKDLAYRLARTGPSPPPPPQSTAYPADSQDGQA